MSHKQPPTLVSLLGDLDVTSQSTYASRDHIRESVGVALVGVEIGSRKKLQSANAQFDRFFRIPDDELKDMD